MLTSDIYPALKKTNVWKYGRLGGFSLKMVIDQTSSGMMCQARTCKWSWTGPEVIVFGPQRDLLEECPFLFFFSITRCHLRFFGMSSGPFNYTNKSGGYIISTCVLENGQSDALHPWSSYNRAAQNQLFSVGHGETYVISSCYIHLCFTSLVSNNQMRHHQHS